jgi:hypothetical protein
VLPHPGFEHRLSDLEARIERLNHAVARRRESDEHLPSLEERLGQVADQCADILKQWAAEPVRQLREQAESLTEICVSTAGSAQTGIERAEARLSTLERDLHRRIDDLSRDLQTVLTELRRQNGAALRGPAAPWALDEVTRLHAELREGGGRQDEPAVLDAAVSRESIEDAAPAASPEPTVAASPDVSAEQAPDRSVTRWYAAVGALGVAIVVATGFAWSFYGRARVAAEQASDAQQRAAQIATAADQRIEAARQEAATQVREARDAASKAEITGDVLAASDLVRFSLTSADGGGRALLLWSRSRGMVFSASRLAAPARGSVYQVWLLTDADPVSAGTVAPDAAGRASMATDTPPNVPRAVTGVRVTLEPEPGSRAPSGSTVLERAQ